MKHQETAKVPDSTYFRVGDAEPIIEDDNSVTLLNGRGSYRSSWGAPQVNTTILVDECDFLVVLIGFSHKHGGGQFYRYYVVGESGIVRKTWRGLTYNEQVLTREAYKEKAPHWAKSPGKLPEERKQPKQSKFIAYKIVRKVDDTSFLSLYDDTEWEIDRRNGQAVSRNAGSHYGEIIHDGGYYVHTDADRIKLLFTNRTLVPDHCYDKDVTYVLVRCECYGRQAYFSSGKIAVTYCTPLEIMETIS